MTDLGFDADELLDALSDPDFVADLTTDELDQAMAALRLIAEAPDQPGRLPHQVTPPDPWFCWAFSAGRGAGKTLTMSDEFYDHIVNGPPCIPNVPGGHRAAIVAPTLGDVATSCYAGPSGLHQIDRRIKWSTREHASFIDFPNGASAKAVGAGTKTQADRLRAHGNTCIVWVEEAAACRRLAQIWAQILLSCRAGKDPRCILSSTPKNTAAYRRILNHPATVVTHGSMYDNPYLEDSFKERTESSFAGTHVEKQEIYGLLVDETPGALWNGTSIDARRVNVAALAKHRPPLPDETHEAWIRRALAITTVYVGLDPATSGRGDRTGVVVVGADNPKLHKDGRRDVFVLEDRTGMMVPSLVDLGDALGDDELPDDIEGWAEVVAETAYRWQADAVVIERNRLGRTGRTVLRAAGLTGRIIEVDASDSKLNRATPVRAAWGRRMWIVGDWPVLETDMTSWVPAEGDDPDELDEDDPDAFTGSPDALDGMVWPSRQLLGIDVPHQKKEASHALGDVMASGWNA